MRTIRGRTQRYKIMRSVRLIIGSKLLVSSNREAQFRSQMQWCKGKLGFSCDNRTRTKYGRIHDLDNLCLAPRRQFQAFSRCMFPSISERFEFGFYLGVAENTSHVPAFFTFRSQRQISLGRTESKAESKATNMPVDANEKATYDLSTVVS